MENLHTSENPCLETECEGSPHAENGENFIFLVADGTVNLSGRDQVFRKPTSIRDYLARGEEHKDDLQGDSDGSQPLDKNGGQ